MQLQGLYAGLSHPTWPPTTQRAPDPLTADVREVDGRHTIMWFRNLFDAAKVHPIMCVTHYGLRIAPWADPDEIPDTETRIAVAAWAALKADPRANLHDVVRRQRAAAAAATS